MTWRSHLTGVLTFQPRVKSQKPRVKSLVLKVFQIKLYFLNLLVTHNMFPTSCLSFSFHFKIFVYHSAHIKHTGGFHHKSMQTSLGSSPWIVKLGNRKHYLSYQLWDFFIFMNCVENIRKVKEFQLWRALLLKAK